ncbi:MAG: hypothetical protein SVW57_13740 [Thermodesulfobacteriota bacterium]|nr:hypothetical protein [Thermodesulfobacteriota bacterium]
MKWNLKFWVGIILILASQPLGIGAVVICNVIALQRQNTVFSLLGIVIYVLGWGMFGMGMLLAGREGVKYSRHLFGKLWNFLTRTENRDKLLERKE